MTILKNVDKVVHFHTDHFEPEVGNIDHVKYWLEKRQEHKHANKASLFYLSKAIKYDESDKRFYFVDEDYDQEVLGLLKESKLDIHVHVHHEHWTTSNYSQLPYDPRRDSERFDEHLSILLPYLRKNVDIPLNWGFIHGKWALNASDPGVCHIRDEIITLKKHGCVGDFSFPAGRGYCDPRIKHPIDIRPWPAVRSYDDPSADPQKILKHVRPRYFLVWSAEATFHALSIEHVDAGTMSQNDILDQWINKSPVIDGVLYIRTFCHTMNSELWKNGKDTPMLSSRVVNTFKKLEELCDQSECPIEYQTASQVIDKLVSNV